MVVDMKTAASGKKSINVTVNETLIEQARALQINVSQAAEAGVAAAVLRAQQERWKNENQAKMDDWNAWVEKNGIPLEGHREF
jgi:antitoxin CcdA